MSSSTKPVAVFGPRGTLVRPTDATTDAGRAVRSATARSVQRTLKMTQAVTEALPSDVACEALRDMAAQGDILMDLDAVRSMRGPLQVGMWVLVEWQLSLFTGFVGRAASATAQSASRAALLSQCLQWLTEAVESCAPPLPHQAAVLEVLRSLAAAQRGAEAEGRGGVAKAARGGDNSAQDARAAAEMFLARAVRVVRLTHGGGGFAARDKGELTRADAQGHTKWRPEVLLEAEGFAAQLSVLLMLACGAALHPLPVAAAPLFADFVVVCNLVLLRSLGCEADHLMDRARAALADASTRLTLLAVTARLSCVSTAFREAATRP